MPNFSPDNAADARAALQDVVRDYGTSGLDNPKVLAQVLPDLLPNAPLASNLLNAASSVGVARLLSDRFAASIPADAAVRDVAALLSQRQAIDTPAAQWVVAEYAHVLGHPVDPALLAQVSPERPAPYMVQPVSGQPVSGQPVSGQPGAGQPAFGQPAFGQPVSAQPGFGQPVSGQPAFGQPVSGQPMSGQPMSGQPASGQPAFGQPVSGQPMSGQPASGQPAFGQPVSGQPMSPQFAPGTAAAGGIPPGGGLGAAAAPATQLDNAPGQDRIAGRAQAPVQPNQGRILDDTAQFPPSQAPGYPQPGYPQPPFPPQPGYPQQPGYPGGYGYVPPRKSRTGLIVGLVILGLLLVGGGVAAILLLGKKNTPSAGPTQPPVIHTTTPPPSTPPSSPPVSLPPSNNGGSTALDQVMPIDLDLTQCSPDDQGLMDNTTEAIDCPEGDNSSLPSSTVYGFQFGNAPDYTNGLKQLNNKINFDPSKSGSSCPPGDSGDGATVWHRNSNPDTQLGKLECYTDTTKHNYYIWTDDNELTIIVVKSTTSQTFTQINTWWSANNNNSNGQ